MNENQISQNIYTNAHCPIHLKQKPTTIGLIKYEQTTRTKYATLLAERLIGSLQKRGVKKSSTPLPLSFPWLTPETLDSSNVLILFSNTRNKQENSSTSYMRLKHVTDCWAVTHKSWMERCSLRPPQF